PGSESVPTRRSSMRSGWKCARRALIAPVAVSLALATATGRGDEPGRLGLGRLFRFGSASSGHTPAPHPSPAADAPPPMPLPGRAPGLPGVATEPATGHPAPTSRLIPQPRVSRAVTEADPLVTRVVLGRSDDGKQFGMFLQVFADGTVIDSEGEHHLGREGI